MSKEEIMEELGPDTRELIKELRKKQQLKKYEDDEEIRAIIRFAWQGMYTTHLTEEDSPMLLLWSHLKWAGLFTLASRALAGEYTGKGKRTWFQRLFSM